MTGGEVVPWDGNGWMWQAEEPRFVPKDLCGVTVRYSGAQNGNSGEA